MKSGNEHWNEHFKNIGRNDLIINDDYNWLDLTILHENDPDILFYNGILKNEIFESESINENRSKKLKDILDEKDKILKLLDDFTNLNSIELKDRFEKDNISSEEGMECIDLWIEIQDAKRTNKNRSKILKNILDD